MQQQSDTLRPWQLTRASLVPVAQTYPIPRVPLAVEGPSVCSEEELYVYAQMLRRLETEPPFVPVFAVGTWSVDIFDGLWQLRRYRLKDLLFPGGDPFASEWGCFSDMQPWLVEKYLGWIQEGHDPPPLRALETEKGHIKIMDGHNRAAAEVRAGRRKALVWVSVAYLKPNGCLTDLTHPLAIELALQAGRRVPAEVLADYPYLAVNDALVKVA